MSKVALQVFRVCVFAPWKRAVDSSIEAMSSKDNLTHVWSLNEEEQRLTHIFSAAVRAAKSTFLCCGDRANSEKSFKKKRSGVKTTSFSNRNYIIAESRKEKVQSIPQKTVNMYRVPPADINCNLGKVTHAYRSVCFSFLIFFVLFGGFSSCFVTLVVFLVKNDQSIKKLLIHFLLCYIVYKYW